MTGQYVFCENTLTSRSLKHLHSTPHHLNLIQVGSRHSDAHSAHYGTTSMISFAVKPQKQKQIRKPSARTNQRITFCYVANEISRAQIIIGHSEINVLVLLPDHFRQTLWFCLGIYLS